MKYFEKYMPLTVTAQWNKTLRILPRWTQTTFTQCKEGTQNSKRPWDRGKPWASLLFIWLVFVHPKICANFRCSIFFLLEDDFQFLLRSLSALMFINVIILVPSATIVKCRWRRDQKKKTEALGTRMKRYKCHSMECESFLFVKKHVSCPAWGLSNSFCNSFIDFLQLWSCFIKWFEKERSTIASTALQP